METVAPWLQPRMDDDQVHPGAKWVLQPVRDGEYWNAVQSNAALSAMAIYNKPTCRHPKGCAGGCWPEDPSKADRMEHPLGQRRTQTYHPSCPEEVKTGFHC